MNFEKNETQKKKQDLFELQEQFKKLKDEEYMAKQFELDRQEKKRLNTMNGVTRIPGETYGQGL